MHTFSRPSRFFVSTVVAAFVFAAVGICAATAQQTQAPTLTPSAFLANPGLLLQQNPNGGPILANEVQQLALADPATFKVLLDLLASANDAQKAAIGTGAAQAAKVEVLTNQALAADWQQQIAAINDTAFKIAATNAFGDVQLGGVGGGPLGGGGGGQTASLPQQSTSPGTTQNIQSTPVPTQSFTSSSSTTGANLSVSP